MARTTAERIAKLMTIRDQLEDRLAEVTLAPKPTYTVDGQNFQWTQYTEMLRKQIMALTTDIGALDRGGGLTMTQVFAGGN